MRVTMVLPALTEATGPLFRPIKYSLFPPLGLATLAGYLDADDEVCIHDEHVEKLRLDDDRPDLAVIQPYITSARRAYELADAYRARGVHVAMGGLHVTSLPDEAAAHADTVFVGPGEDTWPRFLDDLRRGEPRRRYVSSTHHCDFWYKDAFFDGGRSFYTQTVDAALAEIDRLPGRHVYFLDDHLFGNRRFAEGLFAGLRGGRRVWQAAGTVDSVLAPGLLEQAVAAGLRSLFVGFETINGDNLAEQRKRQNIGRDYGAVVRRLHDNGVMVNASFVFGMDGDGPDVFDRTVAWAVEQGIETATFHIMTPYPGTGLYARLRDQGRLLHSDWDLYDTRHVVFRPVGLTPRHLEDGYWRAYRDFYRWGAIWRGAAVKPVVADRLRHLAYAGGWKKFEPLWDVLIRSRQVLRALPLLESLLGSFGARRPG
jgi:radical SAM superfamily enzyme YgiQ (UPF0313 family)